MYWVALSASFPPFRLSSSFFFCSWDKSCFFLFFFCEIKETRPCLYSVSFTTFLGERTRRRSSLFVCWWVSVSFPCEKRTMASSTYSLTRPAPILESKNKRLSDVQYLYLSVRGDFRRKRRREKVNSPFWKWLCTVLQWASEEEKIDALMGQVSFHLSHKDKVWCLGRKVCPLSFVSPVSFPFLRRSFRSVPAVYLLR